MKNEASGKCMTAQQNQKVNIWQEENMKEYDCRAAEMLACKNLSKQFGDFTLDVSLSLKKGNVTGLIGKNGAGKTTLFKTLLGLLAMDSGEIFWKGEPVSYLDKKQRLQIGVVLSDSFVSGFLRADDLLSFMQQMYSDFETEKFLQFCEKYAIPMKKPIREFSTGMKAKLKMLTVLARQTELLILDEPTAGLDVVARDEILCLLREYMENGERSILISSHISTDLEGLCDDIYMIDGGRIILHEDTDVLISEYGVLKMTAEQFASIDKKYLLRVKEEPFGYRALTDQKQFYQENAPQIALEKGSIDELILMMVTGKKGAEN